MINATLAAHAGEVTAHDREVARLTAELAAMKTARDFKGAKAAKAALLAAQAAGVKDVAPSVPAEWVEGDTLGSLRKEADVLNRTDGCFSEFRTTFVQGFAFDNPSKFGLT